MILCLRLQAPAVLLRRQLLVIQELLSLPVFSHLFSNSVDDVVVFQRIVYQDLLAVYLVQRKQTECHNAHNAIMLIIALIFGFAKTS